MEAPQRSQREPAQTSHSSLHISSPTQCFPNPDSHRLHKTFLAPSPAVGSALNQGHSRYIHPRTRLSLVLVLHEKEQAYITLPSTRLNWCLWIGMRMENVFKKILLIWGHSSTIQWPRTSTGASWQSGLYFSANVQDAGVPRSYLKSLGGL